MKITFDNSTKELYRKAVNSYKTVGGVNAPGVGAEIEVCSVSNNNFESISILLCIISFAYLTIKKVIKWRIPVSYVITVFILSMVIDVNIALNLLLFGAIFIATDSPTSPITNYGQIIGGIILGIITIIIKYLTNFYADVVISILIFNVITIAINKLSMRFNFN